MRVLFISAVNETGAQTPLPLGMACVAAATEKADHEVRCLVLGSETEREEVIQQAVEQFRPGVIGISARNIDDQNFACPRFLLDDVREVVTACRAVSRASIVLGGAGYSIFPRSALAYLGADAGIQGDGEVAFPVLLSWIEQGKPGRAPDGVYLVKDVSRSADFTIQLDALALPEARFWLDFPGSTALRIPVQSRRGCPMDCIYYSTSAIQGRAIRHRAPETVVKWLAELRTRGFRHFYFVDNTFNLPAWYAKDLCRKIISAGLGLDWWAIIYPKWVDAELATLMVEAGCTQVSLGFESGSVPVLRQLNKRFRPTEVREISERFAAAGIKRHGFLLLGGPGETRETVEESLAFAHELRLDGLKLTAGIRVYPHTRLAAIAAAEGEVSPDDDLLFPTFYLTRRLRDWLPERMARCNVSPG